MKIPESRAARERYELRRERDGKLRAAVAGYAEIG